jgi:hypothetical protein
MKVCLHIREHYAGQHRCPLQSLRGHLELLAPIFELPRVADIDSAAICRGSAHQLTWQSGGKFGSLWVRNIHKAMLWT